MLTTQYLEEADELADRIAIIDEGTEENQIAEITEAVTQMNGSAIVIRNQLMDWLKEIC